MTRPGDDAVNQIKEKLSIVEVITPYVKLTRAGKHWKGLSPFGKEKTPSFYVDPGRGSYYCFSTSQGGDHFTFIERMEGVDFRGALKILAEKAGVELAAYSPRDQASKDQEDRVREAIALAESHYTAALPGTAALTYARDRGLTDASIAAWGLGYAADGWRGLLEALIARGYTTKELLEAGLIKEADQKPGTYYDRFRDRLMFPIRDAAGRTVAFTGRALSKDEQAKYLNSPETPLFKKSELLFGMDKAKDAIRQRGFAILAEGQFDLLLMHQAGFQNAVAISGTALSSTHLGLIKRYADNLMLCLDADRAGLAAAARSAHAALSAGMRVKAVRLPEGKDPADLLSAEGGIKTFTDLIKDAKPAIDFFLSVLAAEEPDDLRLLRRVEQVVLPLVAAVQSPLERERFVGTVARSLSTTPEAVRATLAQMPRHAPSESDQRTDRPIQSAPAQSGRAASLGPTALDTRHRIIIGAIHGYPGTPLAHRLESEYARIIGSPIPSGDVEERAVYEAALVFGEAPHPEAADDLLREFERLILRDALRDATKDLVRAEREGDSDGIQKASMRCQELQSRFAVLG